MISQPTNEVDTRPFSRCGVRGGYAIPGRCCDDEIDLLIQPKNSHAGTTAFTNRLP
jgi:hypothetical protein